jgi:hypothetical protein
MPDPPHACTASRAHHGSPHRSWGTGGRSIPARAVCAACRPACGGCWCPGASGHQVEGGQLSGEDYLPVAGCCPGVVQFDRSIPGVVRRCELSGGVSVDVRPTALGVAKKGVGHGVGGRGGGVPLPCPHCNQFRSLRQGVAARRESHALPTE